MRVFVNKLFPACITSVPEQASTGLRGRAPHGGVVSSGRAAALRQRWLLPVVLGLPFGLVCQEVSTLELVTQVQRIFAVDPVLRVLPGAPQTTAVIPAEARPAFPVPILGLYLGKCRLAA